MQEAQGTKPNIIAKYNGRREINSKLNASYYLCLVPRLINQIYYQWLEGSKVEIVAKDK